MDLAPDDELAVRATATLRSGTAAQLEVLLREQPALATARIGGGAEWRPVLHVLADWPGHVPEGAAKVAVLVAAGADPAARFTGAHTETALHWAASNDDVEVLDALLDAGADLEAGGAVIAGGTALADAVAFGQWNAARRLVSARSAHDAVAGGGARADRPRRGGARRDGARAGGARQRALVRRARRAARGRGAAARARRRPGLGRPRRAHPGRGRRAQRGGHARRMARGRLSSARRGVRDRARPPTSARRPARGPSPGPPRAASSGHP